MKHLVANEEASIDSALTSAVQKDMFLVIEDLDLVHRDIITSLYNRLVRLNKQDDESKFRTYLLRVNTNRFSVD